MNKIQKSANFKETQKMGKNLARELSGPAVIALSGELGSGKTTFVQGLLKGLGAKGPFTSPTFVVMKEYKLQRKVDSEQKTKNKKLLTADCPQQTVYHIDAYRIGAKDLLALGWKEMIARKDAVILVEWADRVKKIIPPKTIWINFQWLGESNREIIINK